MGLAPAACVSEDVELEKKLVVKDVLVVFQVWEREVLPQGVEPPEPQ